MCISTVYIYIYIYVYMYIYTYIVYKNIYSMKKQELAIHFSQQVLFAKLRGDDIIFEDETPAANLLGWNQPVAMLTNVNN